MKTSLSSFLPHLCVVYFPSQKTGYPSRVAKKIAKLISCQLESLGFFSIPDLSRYAWECPELLQAESG
jgi:hypothetical protein